MPAYHATDAHAIPNPKSDPYAADPYADPYGALRCSNPKSDPKSDPYTSDPYKSDPKSDPYAKKRSN